MDFLQVFDGLVDTSPAPEDSVGPGTSPSVWHSKSQPGLSLSPEEGESTNTVPTRSL